MKDNYIFVGNYIMAADLLTKFSHLTPWVQSVIGISLCLCVLGMAYFVKEAIIAVMTPFYRRCNNKDTTTTPKRLWQDKWYRDTKGNE